MIVQAVVKALQTEFAEYIQKRDESSLFCVDSPPTWRTWIKHAFQLQSVFDDSEEIWLLQQALRITDTCPTFLRKAPWFLEALVTVFDFSNPQNFENLSVGETNTMIYLCNHPSLYFRSTDIIRKSMDKYLKRLKNAQKRRKQKQQKQLHQK